jgi:hypothetical protein
MRPVTRLPPAPTRPRLTLWRTRLLLAGLLVLVAGSLASCLGPKPHVVAVQKQPPAAQNDPYRIQVLIENQGPGDGQVEVSVRLVDKQTQQTILYDEQDVHLDKDERQSVNFEESLPPHAPTADQIDVQVSAQYPPE